MITEVPYFFTNKDWYYYDDKEDGVIAIKFYATQKQIDALQQENKEQEEYIKYWQNEYAKKYISEHYGMNVKGYRTSFSTKEFNLRKEIDKSIRDELYTYVKKRENISVTEIKQKYGTGYGNSKRNYDWNTTDKSEFGIRAKCILEIMQELEKGDK